MTDTETQPEVFNKISETISAYMLEANTPNEFADRVSELVDSQEWDVNELMYMLVQADMDGQVMWGHHWKAVARNHDTFYKMVDIPEVDNDE